ncbi:MAG TPA: hypothetical protein VGU02_03935 [Gaiellaceae bacterium]|nr:hypothetical protein [Gaiellaceae bacterium]
MPADSSVAAELRMESDERNLAMFDDATLIFAMVGLNASGGANMPGWGMTEEAQYMRRMVFSEIARRWIPPDVFAAGFAMAGFDQAADDDE